MTHFDPFRDQDLVRLINSGDDQVARHKAWWDFEEPLPVVMTSLARVLGKKAFYDVGANTGFYSVLVGKVEPDATVRGFEPVDWIAARCRENLAANEVSAQIYDVALSDAVGSATLHFPPDDHGLIETSASLNADFNPVNARSIEVPTRTLDDVVAQFDDTVGLLKIDVEGHEAQVLAGGLNTMLGQRPLTVVEVLPTSDIEGLNRILAPLRYRYFALRSGMVFEPRRQLEFLMDGWNWLLVPAERVQAVHLIIEEGAREFRSTKKPGLLERLRARLG